MKQKDKVGLSLIDWINRQERAEEPQLKKFGLDKSITKGPLDYDWNEIERQIKILLDEVNKREKSRISIRRGGIPDSLVNHRAVRFLSCYVAAARYQYSQDNASEPIPESLLHLIAYQLGVNKFGLNQSRRASELKAAKKYLQDRPQAKNIQIAKAVGVDKSTVTRWRKNGDL